MSKESPYKILSVGGSIIIPKTGFDVKFLKKFRQLILSRVRKGDKFVLVIGGGATCRAYQNALTQAIKLPNRQLHWLGIYTTWFNAEFVRLLFSGKYVYESVIKNPTDKIVTNKSIIIAGGWKPGFSTDTDSVLLAKQFCAKEVLNLSNIDYVYDKDPNKFSNTKKIEKINWKDFRKNIVGYKWLPGKNSPFDPIASGLADKLGLKVMIMNGNNLAEVRKALEGRRFKGTVIQSFDTLST
ncbi:MAG: UMP kinase [Candidatus Magasanikbacteria bacterium]|nr:UMP kinase [Candidatus Magasanikbacteria bacterium]